MTSDGEHGDEGDTVGRDGLDPRFDPRFQRGYSAPVEPGSAAPAEPRADEKRPAGIDPRFDPRFQRGFDPERHEQVRRPPTPSDVDDRPAFASTVKAGLPRPIETPVSRPAARTPVLPAAGRPAAVSAETPVPTGTTAGGAPASSPAPDLAAMGRNPWIIALWIACAVLVVVGIATIVQSASNRSSGFILSLGDAVSLSIGTIAPVAVTVGLIGLVALTLGHALGWLGRHPDSGATDGADGDADGWGDTP